MRITDKERMTVEEHIRNLAGDYKCWSNKISEQEALEINEVFEERQQYRAIGTVEGIKAELCFLTTYRRADSDGRLILILDKMGCCDELGGLHIDEIRRRCHVKEEAEKPIRQELPLIGLVARCQCGLVLTRNHKYCYECGVKIDWSDEE